MYLCHVSLLSNTQGSFVRFIVKTGLDKIVAHLTNNSLFKKRFFNRPIRFLGSNFDSGEINGNVIGSARSKDLTAWARGLSPISTTYSDVPCRWRARRPLASRVAGSIVRYQLLLLCKCKAFCNDLIYTKHTINYQTALHYFVFYNYFTLHKQYFVEHSSSIIA